MELKDNDVTNNTDGFQITDVDIGNIENAEHDGDMEIEIHKYIILGLVNVFSLGEVSI